MFITYTLSPPKEFGCQNSLLFKNFYFINILSYTGKISKLFFFLEILVLLPLSNLNIDRSISLELYLLTPVSPYQQPLQLQLDTHTKSFGKLMKHVDN